MIADGNRRGYRHLLDGFWDEARSYGLALPTEVPISAPSFCSARHKITPDLLRHMLNQVAETSLPTTFGSNLWRERRVFAIDGTKINLQRSYELEREFGVPEGAHCPQILVSVLLDVCAKVPVDVEISPFASCERGQMLRLLPRLTEGDVLVLDRGYPSHKVIQELVQAKVDFLIRMPSSHTFAAIDTLREGDGDDYMFYVDPPEGSPVDWKPLKIRVVRLKGPDGSESFYFTTLGRKAFSRASLRELYHMRWEAEEHYKLLKSPYIGQGQFRSKSAEGVRQEIHALVLFLAIARVLMSTAAKVTGTEYESRSQKAAVLGLAAYVTRLFLVSDPMAARIELGALLERIARPPQKPRPGRSYPRRSFKPGPRWNSRGRTGG